MWVVVLHDRSAIPKQCNHVRCGGVAGVSNVRLERDTDHSHPGAAHRARSVIERLGHQVDHVAGHGQVDVTGQLDESVHEVELAGSP